MLGGGVDDIYPPDNRGLYEKIRDHGLLVSESPVSHRATASDFPRRNRIISGLSLGTIVGRGRTALRFADHRPAGSQAEP
ncbi:DNA-processing protein DprA [Asticcacaulis benevestitus]|uniref:DNA-processing protein DprA n=1 Tax=Asticcacaulis benevestitus TaxID=347481 RepID=UPI00039B5BD6|nr:DNA-processing protein DprA [Asticcacaulis benevestitus]